MEETTTHRGTFVRCVQMEGLSMMLSWHHGDQVQRQPTTDQCRDGWSIAEDGASIPIIQLSVRSMIFCMFCSHKD